MLFDNIINFYNTHKIIIFFTCIGAVISAFLGLLFYAIYGYLKNKVNYWKTFRKEILKAILGIWYSYHFTTAEDHKIIFREQEWKFELAPNGDINIITKDEKNLELVYVGKLFISEKPEESDITNNSLICNMKGKYHVERFHIRLRYPIPGTTGFTYGIKVGVDFENEIFTTIYMFSRNRLDRASAEKEVLNKLIDCSSKHFLKLAY